MIPSNLPSLHNYRAFLTAHGFTEPVLYAVEDGTESRRLTIAGHSLAGLFAGWTK